ncbi:pilus assembly protein, partial [bacterium]|nr:pilus assembly protein [bacterium]
MGYRGAKRHERGQVAILFALVFTFMFILFAMVVDFGHLVNNKINLQNAADAAAYSGAAWQAQALNRLGQINYRLRQNVKELTMRAEVTHMRHNKNFPRGSSEYNSNGGDPSVEPFMCQQAHGYKALSGLKYRFDTNLCKNASPSSGGLPPIVVPPVIADWDPFAVAIAAQIRKIADAGKQECAAAALDNQRLAQHLVNVYTSRSRFHAGQVRELESWINQVGGGNPENIQHPIAKVALTTAKNNLTLANRDAFQMQILAPSTGEYVRLNEQDLRASLLFIKFNVEGEG